MIGVETGVFILNLVVWSVPIIYFSVNKDSKINAEIIINRVNSMY